METATATRVKTGWVCQNKAGGCYIRCSAWPGDLQKARVISTRKLARQLSTSSEVVRKVEQDENGHITIVKGR